MDMASVPTDGSGRVLEIGNGWGSFLLYAAAKHPAVTFLGFSNSATQQAHIAAEASKRGLANVASLRVDINDFARTVCRAATAPGSLTGSSVVNASSTAKTTARRSKPWPRC